MQKPANKTHDRSAQEALALRAKALELVRLTLETTAEAGSGHPTSAASLAHVVAALMYRHMRWDPSEPDHPAADRLILSEGHACPIVYSAGADLGVAIGRGERRPMTPADAFSLRAIEGPIDGHPNPALGFPFFPAATGSLGQGLSIAAGIALAARLDSLSRRVFCVVGDGESREGQVWEAVDFLVDHGLTAVCPIFNANRFGQTGPVSSQQSPEALARKLTAFGVEPIVIDGHDPAAILAALRRHEAAHERGDGELVALVTRTTKGWGTPSLAAQESGKHGKPAEGDELARALAELEAERQRCGAPNEAAGLPELRPIPEEDALSPRHAPEGRDLPAFEDALAESGDTEVLQPGGKLATRAAYGLALRALGRARGEIVALDGDVSNSTHAEVFARDEATVDRYFECRIAEQNMVSVAVGLASAGKLPYVSTFGKFLTRAYDQIEMALVGGTPLRLVGSHVGVSLAADGPSQMALPDAAWFAAWSRVRRGAERPMLVPPGEGAIDASPSAPLLWVVTPADARAAFALTLETATHAGAVYLRTMRPAVPLLYGPTERFPLGGHKVVRRGEDLLIVAWGFLVHVALRAAAELRERGIEATVVDLYSLPCDGDAVVARARENRGRLLTLEDNFGGALGASVSEALADAAADVALTRMFVRDVPRSGRTPDTVLRDLGLDAERVVAAAVALVEG